MAPSPCSLLPVPSCQTGWSTGTDSITGRRGAAARDPFPAALEALGPKKGGHRGLGPRARFRNVEITEGQFDDMPSQYQASGGQYVRSLYRAHRCKPMPNSLIESLACGRPILCMPVVGLAGMVQEGCGAVIVSASGVEIAEGLEPATRAGRPTPSPPGNWRSGVLLWSGSSRTISGGLIT